MIKQLRSPTVYTLRHPRDEQQKETTVTPGMEGQRDRVMFLDPRSWNHSIECRSGPEAIVYVAAARDAKKSKRKRH